MLRWNPVSSCTVLARPDLQGHARRLQLPQVLLKGRGDLGGFLTGDEPTGDLRMRLGWQDRLAALALITTPHAVKLKRRPVPVTLQRAVTFLAIHLGGADFSQVLLVRERQVVQLFPLDGAQLLNAVVETGHGNASVFIVQAGYELRQRMQWVRDATAVAARVQVAAGPTQGELERNHSA